MENSNNSKPYYLVKLYGANPNSQSSQAKVSLNKLDHITPHKWYLGKDGYSFNQLYVK
jgi:hypothetical protein